MKKRMPKGWTMISTNAVEVESKTRQENQKISNMIRNTKSKSYDDLVIQANESFKAEEQRKANLLQAYEDKKLKSKALIKEAQVIKKAKAKAAEKKAAKVVKAENTVAE